MGGCTGLYHPFDGTPASYIAFGEVTVDAADGSTSDVPGLGHVSAAPIPEPGTGLTASLGRTVADERHRAWRSGSGSLPVLGTPLLLAWCEAATCAALAGSLAEGGTSVGTRVSVEHTAPSPVGAVLERHRRRRPRRRPAGRFTVAARQDGKLVGSGEVTRVVVDAERFLARVPGSSPG